MAGLSDVGVAGTPWTHHLAWGPELTPPLRTAYESITCGAESICTHHIRARRAAPGITHSPGVVLAALKVHHIIAAARSRRRQRARGLDSAARWYYHPHVGWYGPEPGISGGCQCTM